jgi:adenylate/nucleoside-diphosphate kinase
MITISGLIVYAIVAGNYLTVKMCDKKEIVVQLVEDEPEEAFPAYAPSPIAYPRANLYYAFAEDVHAMKRIDVASTVFREKKLLPSKRPKDFQMEDEAVYEYLSSAPPSFIIFGKPGLNQADIASAIADAWNCILISPSTLTDTEQGRCVERILRTGGYRGPEILMDWIRSRVRMRDVKHRGYIIEGLPLLPPSRSFDLSCPCPLPATDHAETCGQAPGIPCMPPGIPITCENPNCKTHIDDKQISEVVNEIFTVWPMKPMIIIYVVCPSKDIASKRTEVKADIIRADTIETETDEFAAEVFEDEAEYEEPVPFDFFDVTDEDISNDDAKVVEEFAEENNEKKRIKAECHFYERLALPVIDKWILAHDPQHVIRVDGRNSVQWILQILKTRLYTLALQPSILPKRMIEYHDDYAEAPETNDEFAEMSVEEAFEILRHRGIVSPNFPWGLSMWRFYCPVSLIQGRTVRGHPKYAVQFLSKIYFLSSEEAQNLFVENPRTFLSSPNPRPTCKIAVFGPRYSGKSELCAQLAREFGGTVIDVDEIINEFIEREESTSPQTHDNESATQILPDQGEYTRDEPADIFISKKADIIVENIRNIPVERLDDDLERDGGYILDGMCPDVDVWRKIVDANIVFEDIIVLFEEEPYTFLLNNLRSSLRFDDVTEEGVEAYEDNAEWKYLEHLTRFESNWKKFEMHISEFFDGNVIKCDLAEIKDVARYVINQIRSRFTAIETEIVDIEFEEEHEEAEDIEDIMEDIDVMEADSIDEQVEKEEQKPSAFTIDVQTAERLLECGYYFFSSFGRWCPVQVYTNQVPIQMFLPMKARGEIFPLIRPPYIYFAAGEEALAAFVSDPLKYQNSIAPNVSIPLRISIIGPRRCGKTTLANRFAETYGLKMINATKALHHMLEHYHWLESVRMIEDQLQTDQLAPIESVTRAIEMFCLGQRATTQGYVLDDFPFSRKQAELLILLGLQPMIVLYLKKDQICPEEYSDNENADRPLYFSSSLRRYYASEKDQADFLDWLKKFSQNMIELDVTKSNWYMWTQADAAVRSRFAEIMLYFRNVDMDKVHRLRYMCVSPFEFKMRQSQYKSYCPVCYFYENILRTSGQLVDAEGMVQFREYFYWICPQHLNAFVRDPLRYLPPNNVALPDELPRRLWETIDPEHACWARRLQDEGFCLVTYVDSPSDDRKVIRSRIDLGVIFMDKVYLFCSEECREKFLERPVVYSKKEIPRDIMPIDLPSLPSVNFLKITVSQMLVKVVNLIVKHRPKIFGLSATVSAAIYIGIYLKIHNVSASLNEVDIYKNVNDRITKRGRIIKIVTDTMKRKLNPYVSLPKYSD